MRALLLALALLATASGANAQLNNNGATILRLDGVTVQIMFETLRGPARVVVPGVDAATPLQSISFSPRQRPGPRGSVRLSRGDNGTYSGRGRLASPADVRSVSLNFEEVKVTFRTPDGLASGESTFEARVVPGSASPGPITASVTTGSGETVIRFD